VTFALYTCADPGQLDILPSPQSLKLSRLFAFVELPCVVKAFLDGFNKKIQGSLFPLSPRWCSSGPYFTSSISSSLSFSPPPSLVFCLASYDTFMFRFVADSHALPLGGHNPFVPRGDPAVLLSCL